MERLQKRKTPCERHLCRIIKGGASSNPELAASRLIDEFGSLAAVLAAPRLRQLAVAANDLAAIRQIQDFRRTMMFALRAPLYDGPLLTNWRALLDYLHADLGCLINERVRILHLNTGNLLIRDEVISDGSIDEAAVYVREVIRRAVELGSAAIIIVHNHPAGDPSPSRADIDLTRNVTNAGKALGIAVHDHLIIGRAGHSSLRALGLL